MNRWYPHSNEHTSCQAKAARASECMSSLRHSNLQSTRRLKPLQSIMLIKYHSQSSCTVNASSCKKSVNWGNGNDETARVYIYPEELFSSKLHKILPLRFNQARMRKRFSISEICSAVFIWVIVNLLICSYSITSTHHCTLYNGVVWPSLSTWRKMHWYFIIYKTILGLLPSSLSSHSTEKCW